MPQTDPCPTSGPILPTRKGPFRATDTRDATFILANAFGLNSKELVNNTGLWGDDFTNIQDPTLTAANQNLTLDIGTLKAKNLDIDGISADAQATFRDGVTVEGKLTVAGETNLNSNVTVDADLTVKKSVIVPDGQVETAQLDATTGKIVNLTVSGEATLQSNVTVDASLTANNISVTNNLDVSGDTTLSGEVTMTKETTLKSDATFEKNVVVKQLADMEDMVVRNTFMLAAEGSEENPSIQMSKDKFVSNVNASILDSTFVVQMLEEDGDSPQSILSADPTGAGDAYVTVSAIANTKAALFVNGDMTLGAGKEQHFTIRSSRKSELGLGSAIRIVDTDQDAMFNTREDERLSRAQALILGNDDLGPENERPERALLVFSGQGDSMNADMEPYVAPFMIGRMDDERPERVIFGGLDSRDASDESITHPVGKNPSIAVFSTEVEFMSGITVAGIISNPRDCEPTRIQDLSALSSLRMEDTFRPHDVAENDPTTVTAKFFEVGVKHYQTEEDEGSELFYPKEIGTAVFGMPDDSIQYTNKNGDIVAKHYKVQTTMYGPSDEDKHALTVHGGTRTDVLIVGGDAAPGTTSDPSTSVGGLLYTERVSERMLTDENDKVPAEFLIRGDEGDGAERTQLRFDVDVSFGGKVNFAASGQNELPVQKLVLTSVDAKGVVDEESQKGTLRFDIPVLAEGAQPLDETSAELKQIRIQRSLRSNELLLSEADLQMDSDRAFVFANQSSTDVSPRVSISQFMDSRDGASVKGVRVSHELRVDDRMSATERITLHNSKAKAGEEGAAAKAVTISVQDDRKMVIDAKSLQLTGDFIIDGKTTTRDTEHLRVANSSILLNAVRNSEGELKDEVANDIFTGLEVHRGQELNYHFGFVGQNDTFISGEQNVFVVGKFNRDEETGAIEFDDSNTVQAVMTRASREAMHHNSLVYWDDEDKQGERTARTVEDISLGESGTEVPLICKDGVSESTKFPFLSVGGSFDPEMLEEDNEDLERKRDLFVQGNVFAIHGVFRDIVTYSDERLKTNIHTVESGLDTVNKLRGVHYNWKADADGEKIYGVVAQEVEQVVPELIHENEATKYKTVNYTGMNALFIEAIKELTQQVATLKEELAQVKKQIPA